jgi:hypothetical protein
MLKEWILFFSLFSGCSVLVVSNVHSISHGNVRPRTSSKVTKRTTLYTFTSLFTMFIHCILHAYIVQRDLSSSEGP